MKLFSNKSIFLGSESIVNARFCISVFAGLTLMFLPTEMYSMLLPKGKTLESFFKNCDWSYGNNKYKIQDFARCYKSRAVCKDGQSWDQRQRELVRRFLTRIDLGRKSYLDPLNDYQSRLVLGLMALKSEEGRKLIAIKPVLGSYCSGVGLDKFLRLIEHDSGLAHRLAQKVKQVYTYQDDQLKKTMNQCAYASKDDFVARRFFFEATLEEFYARGQVASAKDTFYLPERVLHELMEASAVPDGHYRQISTGKSIDLEVNHPFLTEMGLFFTTRDGQETVYVHEPETARFVAY